MNFPKTVDELIDACNVRNPAGESTSTYRAVNGTKYVMLDSGGLHGEGERRPAMYVTPEAACAGFWCFYCMMVPEGATVYWRRPIEMASTEIYRDRIDIGEGHMEPLTVYGVSARLTWDQ